MPKILGNMTQETIVFLLAAALFIAASAMLHGFIQADNLIAIVRSVSVLGILAVGMGIVIIGQGIDLSSVAIMAMSVAWYLQMLQNGVPDSEALPIVLGGVILIGFINGFLVAYADIPAIFATLASGYFVYGFARSQLIAQDATPVPSGNWIDALGQIHLINVPVEVFFFSGVAFLAFLFLRFTKWGRYVYLMGDNFMAARNMGIPVRPMMMIPIPTARMPSTLTLRTIETRLSGAMKPGRNIAAAAKVAAARTKTICS